MASGGVAWPLAEWRGLIRRGAAAGGYNLTAGHLDLTQHGRVHAAKGLVRMVRYGVELADVFVLVVNLPSAARSCTDRIDKRGHLGSGARMQTVKEARGGWVCECVGARARERA